MGTVTFVEEYHEVVDRSKWPAGPWDGEPDKAVWVDEATGLDCMIVRQGNSGHLCGYVGVGPDHPWHATTYSTCTVGCDEGWCGHTPESRLEVHGGITFSERCHPDPKGPGHGICHLARPGRPEPVWWFGFDCAHYMDLQPLILSTLGREVLDDSPLGNGTYRTVGYVVGECEDLARQLAGVAGS